jgi:hypothetical protein
MTHREGNGRRRPAGGWYSLAAQNEKRIRVSLFREESNPVEVVNEERFIRGVESLINPMSVSDLLFLQRLKGLLPPPIMKRLLHRAAKKNPYIGFVIEPYSLFLFFKLKDVRAAESLLPDRYELAKTRIFADDEPDYYLGIGNLSTRASTFWGVRQESYLIARDTKTGLLSWIFIGILSNTLIALPTKGIADPNSRNSIFTTNAKGEVFLDFSENGTNRRFSLTGSLRRGTRRRLDEEIWLMGNTSIGHSRAFAVGEDTPFAVIFDPVEVAEAWDVPTEDIRITEDTLFPGLAEREPSRAVCFPFAQHYIADSPGCRTFIKDRDDLIRNYNSLGASEKFETFSARTIVVQLSAGIAVTVLLAVLLALVL